jgi:hypothetical protein
VGVVIRVAGSPVAGGVPEVAQFPPVRQTICVGVGRIDIDTDELDPIDRHPPGSAGVGNFQRGAGLGRIHVVGAEVDPLVSVGSLVDIERVG